MEQKNNDTLSAVMTMLTVVSVVKKVTNGRAKNSDLENLTSIKGLNKKLSSINNAVKLVGKVNNLLK